VNERTVARVVGVLFGAAGRPVTDMVIDAWAVALANTPDRGDELEVAADLALANDFATVAQFHEALRHARRRRSLKAPALAAGDDGYDPAVAAEWVPRIKADLAAWQNRDAATLGAYERPRRTLQPCAGCGRVLVYRTGQRCAWCTNEAQEPERATSAEPGHVAATLADWLPYDADDPAECWNGGGELEEGAGC
jgi:hypothetical protein